jgi:hypothetical protein
VYSGYRKAIREANVLRSAEGRPQIRNAYCNAHARRYFFKAYPQYPEAQFYLDHYHEIYRCEASAQGKPPPLILKARAQMRDRFELMKSKALEELPGYPRNGKYGKALRYLIEHIEGLTLFLEDEKVPIDNNRQERLLRSHVVGRKCWYGTHSEHLQLPTCRNEQKQVNTPSLWGYKWHHGLHQNSRTSTLEMTG